MGEHANEVFPLFFAVTACVYGVGALTPAGQKYGAIELPFVLLVFLTSVLVVLTSTVWIAAVYVIHGGWDVLHHKYIIGTAQIVAWFPDMRLFRSHRWPVCSDPISQLIADQFTFKVKMAQSGMRRDTQYNDSWRRQGQPESLPM